MADKLSTFEFDLHEFTCSKLVLWGVILCQAITWNNDNCFVIEPFTNFSANWMKIENFDDI